MIATNHSRNVTRWTREQIRAARMAALVPLLQQRGLQIIERQAGNYVLPAYPGLIVKDSYWRWPQKWTPLFGPRNAEIKLVSQALLN